MQVLLLMVILFGLPAGCSTPRGAIGQSEIVWEPGRTLAWDDFNPRTGSAGVFKAMTTSGMRYTIDAPDGKVRIHAEAYFLPGESWVHIDHKQASLLRHEQGHFDLSAVYARRLSAALKPFEVTAAEFTERRLNEQAEALFQQFYVELNETQQRYDRETVHGTLDDAQLRWEAWISTELSR